MSRIGKQIIELPKGVEISIQGQDVTVKSSKGTLALTLPEGIGLDIQENQVVTTIANEQDQQQRMLWGTNASLVKNMVVGLSEGFKKELEVNGVGFKVAMKGKNLELALGFSHPVVYAIPEGITCEVEKNKITISGIDKQLVGQVASHIRGFKKPEPYKGKGIKYIDEVIRRKAGKAASAE